jgi:hypothetical protein
MPHAFKIDDTVRLSFGFHDRTGDGVYVVVACPPQNASGEETYHLRGPDDRIRAVAERQIAGLADQVHSPTRMRSPHNPITDLFNELKRRELG